MGCGASKSSVITSADREPEPQFKQQAAPIKLSSSPEKRPLPMLGNEAPLPQIGGKPSSLSSLPPLTQQRITRNMDSYPSSAITSTTTLPPTPPMRSVATRNGGVSRENYEGMLERNAVAFELNLDDNTLGAPKRIPKRLRRLDPIAALPKISMTQLQDQQEVADLKRKRIIEGKRARSARSSRRRREIQRARAQAADQQARLEAAGVPIASDSMTPGPVPRSMTPRPQEEMGNPTSMRGAMPRIREGQLASVQGAGQISANAEAADADTVPEIKQKRFTEDTPLPAPGAAVDGEARSQNRDQERAQDRSYLTASENGSRVGVSAASDVYYSQQMPTAKPPFSPVPPPPREGSARTGSGRPRPLSRHSPLPPSNLADLRRSGPEQDRAQSPYDRERDRRPLDREDLNRGGRSLYDGERDPERKGSGSLKKADRVSNDDEGILSEKDDGTEDDWLVDDRAGKKRGGKSRGMGAGTTSVGGHTGGEVEERRGSALGTTRESSAESGIHSAEAGSRKPLSLPAAGSGQATRGGPAGGDDDFF